MSNLLALEAVTKYFAPAEPVLKNLTLEVAQGEIISLVGPSGCGKSTLLRLISGLDRDHEGKVTVDGIPSSGPNPAIGLMFQEPRLLPWLNVWDNVAFGLNKGSRRSPENLVEELLKRVDLAGKGKMLPRELSGGMAQRVALARALAAKPGILLLDEPFSALDTFTRMKLQELLLAVWQHYRPTTLLVTHDINEALYLSDRVVVLTERPARIHQIIETGIPRPRDRRDPELIRHQALLLEVLHLAGVKE